MENTIKTKATLISAIICGVIIIFVIGMFIFQSVTDDRISPHIYIALGDSVSSGYGLVGYAHSPEGRHTALFFEKIRNDGYVDEFHSFATSGFTTSDVLDLLNNLNDSERRVFNNARIITLNIGGNNLLTPFLAYLTDLEVVSGAGNIRTGVGGVVSGTWGIIYEIISGVGNSPSPDDDTRFSFGGVVRGFGDIVIGLGELLVGAGEIIGGYPDVVSTWRGTLSPELEALFDEGVNTFSQEFVEIITWLETHAPNATIMVNTIFNPIPEEILSVSVPISNWSSMLINAMNDTIIDESDNRNFVVTDVYSFFSYRLDLTSFNLNPFAGEISFDLVHPNAEGHMLIAEHNYIAFSQYASSRN
ncbi:MAG: SGNH/GDSL hydrolase family protein [Defluviitaleaceae bacterium]|nr:SGNH/GDSL hydrolase family protein [Defluviitaleaceae bacterium]